MALALIVLILFLLAPFIIGPLLAVLRIREERRSAPLSPAPTGSRFRARRPQPGRLRRKLPPAA